MSNTASPTRTNDTDDKQQIFLQLAAGGLASMRSVLLIAAQTGDPSNLAAPFRTVVRLRTEAEVLDHREIAGLAEQCCLLLERLIAMSRCSANDAFEVLDLIARIEAALWNVPLHSPEFMSDVSQFVEASFGDLVPSVSRESFAESEQFEIDEETMEIFRFEATDLLGGMASALEVLSRTPADQNAIWDLRRHAHTFKGAAGIIGLQSASETAHQMEDLLSGMAEKQLAAAPIACEFLKASARRLDIIVNAERAEDDPRTLDDQYKKVMRWLASPLTSESGDPAQPSTSTGDGKVKPTTTPIVRVSVERLDEIIKITQDLAASWSSAAEGFAELHNGGSLAALGSLLNGQRSLTDELQAKLQQIRMVRFGTLKTRLSRAVHVTCIDEKKKAVVEIENGEVEIDTLMIDAVIEPLLHLLKNAIVHGIETPDTRRFLGKDETGLIVVRIEADNEGLMLSVSDDGAGISIARLKDKALNAGVIDGLTAASMDDLAATDLIFNKGLTTASKVDLNAGRGVGMSIVKESVEARGGTVLVESAPQQGSTFTILMPISRPSDKVESEEPVTDLPVSEAALVMIVDDSPSMRHFTSKMVKGAGYRIVNVADGADAVELLLNGQCDPDLILSDVEMPQVNGWELLRFVKTNANLTNIPVVLVTSLDADHNRRRAFELGAFDYIVKPFKEEHLESILRNLPNLATA